MQMFLSKINARLTIKARIISGFLLISLFLLGTGATGLYGIQLLRQSLEYITTSAWDTADGAMEGTIGIEAEMLGIARTMERTKADQPVHNLVSEGSATAEEALGRMASAGLIDQQRVDQITALRTNFTSTRQALIESHNTYLRHRNQLEDNFYAFQQLMESAEELGDSQVEELRNEPDRKISWNTGLADKWTAADGAMESNIGLLQRIYFFERLTSGHDFDESIQGLSEALEFLEESLNELIDHPIFLFTRIESEGAGKLSYSNHFEQAMASHISDFEQSIDAYSKFAKSKQAYDLAADELLSAIEIVEEMGDSTVEGEVENISQSSDRASLLMDTALILGLILAGLASWLIVRNVIGPMNYAVTLAKAVAGGKLDSEIEISTNDEMGQLLGALSDMQTNIRERIETEQKLSRENGRIRQALDNVSTSVVVTDGDEKVVYLNEAMQMLMTHSEAAFKAQSSQFDANRLVGHGLDWLYRNPQIKRNDIETLSSTHKTEIEVSDHYFNLVFNPVLDEKGQRNGIVIEWENRTDEVLFEKDVEDLISAAQQGDLSKRIDNRSLSGFFENLSNGMNQMLDVVSGAFEDIAEVMAALAQGDFRNNMQGDYSGTFAKVQEDINRTIEQLRETVLSVRESADKVSSGATEISSGNRSLSSRTEQQAAQLEETASSMEELIATVSQNSDNAQKANQLASDARNTAESGGEVIGNAIVAMEEINAASNQIADIVGVIDEIAFQTNLLALNASVEAARAGEQGRGFAVVATEVRNLAQRSAVSAREIKDLILDSVSKIETGAKLVNESGDSLKDIVNSVINVGEIVADIAHASKEQAAGIDEINKNITNMDDLTQQNSALAEQVSAASSAMNDQSATMSSQIRFFKTG